MSLSSVIKATDSCPSLTRKSRNTFIGIGRFFGVVSFLSAISIPSFAACSYVVNNEWSNGFTATINVINTSSVAVNGWNVSWQYSQTDRVSSFWNANLSGTNPYSATNISWNGTLQPGQSAQFGFQGTKGTAKAEVPNISGNICTGTVSSSSSVNSSNSSISSSSKTSSSISSSISSSSSSVVLGSAYCNWYGQHTPLCNNTSSGWGYENNQSCVAVSTCSGQPAPYGVVNGAASSSSSSVVSSSKSSSSIASSLSSSSSKPSSSSSSSSSLSSTSSSSSVVSYQGVNLSGAEFGATSLPGIYGTDYIYPAQTDVSYFKSKGMNTVRLPFLWERLQPTLNAPLDATELTRLDAFVSAATQSGINVLIDPHNYARYRGNIIGSTSVPNAAFADFWSRLAAHYKANNQVLFGLMNEPHDMPTEQWLSAANTAIAAIRGTGATNLITVPGNGYTGAASWNLNWYGTANSTVMLGVVDSGNNYVYEVHQYLDSDNSGTHDTCVSNTIGAENLTAFTTWLIANHKRGLLGEFAGGNNTTCQNAVTGMLIYMKNNNNVWMGWTWWSAGPWWGNYMYSLEPTTTGTDAAQMNWLTPYLQ